VGDAVQNLKDVWLVEQRPFLQHLTQSTTDLNERLFQNYLPRQAMYRSIQEI
jgi:hypothetical protein